MSFTFIDEIVPWDELAYKAIRDAMEKVNPETIDTTQPWKPREHDADSLLPQVPRSA